MRKAFSSIVAIVVLAALIPMAPSPVLAADDVVIDNSRGVDSRVDYRRLVQFGPWDDRNYELTLEDLELLAANEDELVLHIPAFFRVEMRRNIPDMLREGPAQYPRSAPEVFRIMYGGLLIDGEIQRDGGEGVELEKTVNGEYFVEDGAESAIAINPTDVNKVVAGFNGAVGGQQMMYSTNAGQTWSNSSGPAVNGTSGVLTGSCCDPTVGYSSDASVVYTSALMNCTFSCGVSAFRSTDDGQTWGGAVNLVSSGCDKNFLHVDIHPDSPHLDNIYQTWHCSNTMQFARSTDMGLTYEPTIAFGSDPSGIGSDITSDSTGKIYYVWPATSATSIELKTSTNGGVSFASGSLSIAQTTASFDFPIPAMESRRAWIYVSADTDLSNGPYKDTIYVAWTDSTADSGTASNNHTQIFFSKSTDSGASWSTSIPHETADVLTVDRFNQWMEVDANGIIHLVYYTTEYTGGRTEVDLAYQYSEDAGATWSVPERVTSTSSANPSDSFEYGDYNGVDILESVVMPIYTDNSSSIDVHVADVLNQAVNPDFTVQASNTEQTVCKPGSATSISIDVGQMLDFANPVTLAWQSLPTGFSGSVIGSPVTPPNTATATLSLTSGAALGTTQLVIAGTATDSPGHDIDVTIEAVQAVVAGPALLAPADNAIDIDLTPTYAWGAVVGGGTYDIQVATDAPFSNIVASASDVEDLSWLSSVLGPSTQYFWRVRRSNACGNGPWSAISSFTTASIACLNIPGSDVPKVLNDPGLTTSAINVGAVNITDVDVQLDLDHDWVGELVITLSSPEGTEVVLLDRPGHPASAFGCSNDDMVVTFDDDSATDLEDLCAGDAPWFTGTAAPVGSLSAFDGERIAGDWTLTVNDNVNGFSGTLQSWSVDLCFDTGIDPGAIFADGFESGNLSSWSPAR